MTSFHSNWLQSLQANAKKTYAREAFAINNSTVHQKTKATKMSVNGSFGPVHVTVTQNATANNPFIYSIVGVIIGGGIGIVSGVVVDKVNSWRKRPEISIDEDTTEGDFHLQKGEIRGTVGDLAIPIIERPFIKYIGTRIKVKNDGSSAAEGCKATLIINGTRELRVGWMIREQDCTVTINAHDIEYIDLCAISEDGTDRVFTTEHGYGDYVDRARRLEEDVIYAKLKVSAKNAKQCVKSVRISNIRDDQNKIVRLSD